ncbi:T9SS type A sorting domain-containing protein [Bacteroidota bacterium]
MKVYFIIIPFLLIVSRVLSADIVPSGTADDANTIQTSLDGLHEGDTLRLNGDFVIGRTIYMPSNFTWILNGSLTLSGNAELEKVGWVEPGVDARRRTGITEKTGGATNIDMSGGAYHGNSANYPYSMRFINYVSVTNSRFHDMHITDATDDNFTLGPGSNHNECRNLIGSFAGGNALTDKGDHNKWYDCIAEDCASDGWTPKCRNSEFHRCIARRNAAPGFGCFARLDGSNPDQGEIITGNKFYACESYDNGRGGFSFNIAGTSGPGSIIRDNYIQAVCYNNKMQGVTFRNKQADGIIENNEVDILVYGNQGLTNDGTLSDYAGGLGTDGSPINSITGSVVGYDNGGYDVNIRTATNCTLTVYNPDDRSPAVMDKGDNTNIINEISFTCSQTLDKWCMQVYCNQKAVHIPSAESQTLFSLSQNYPNPFNFETIISYNLIKDSHISLSIYNIYGKKISTLAANEYHSSGTHYVVWNAANDKGLSVPNGVYICVLDVVNNDGVFIKSHKMNFIK